MLGHVSIGVESNIGFVIWEGGIVSCGSKSLHPVLGRIHGLGMLSEQCSMNEVSDEDFR